MSHAFSRLVLKESNMPALTGRIPDGFCWTNITQFTLEVLASRQIHTLDNELTLQSLELL